MRYAQKFPMRSTNLISSFCGAPSGYGRVSLCNGFPGVETLG
jgi:hypothetical protein